jgi:hypothetical protein
VSDVVGATAVVPDSDSVPVPPVVGASVEASTVVPVVVVSGGVCVVGNEVTSVAEPRPLSSPHAAGRRRTGTRRRREVQAFMPPRIDEERPLRTPQGACATSL